MSKWRSISRASRRQAFERRDPATADTAKTADVSAMICRAKVMTTGASDLIDASGLDEGTGYDRTTGYA